MIAELAAVAVMIYLGKRATPARATGNATPSTDPTYQPNGGSDTKQAPPPSGGSAPMAGPARQAPMRPFIDPVTGGSNAPFVPTRPEIGMPSVRTRPAPAVGSADPAPMDDLPGYVKRAPLV